jgi:hypothetical protein
MSRQGMSDARKHDIAIQAARRTVSRGERPGYRVVQLPSGDWSVDGPPGVEVTRASRRDAPPVALELHHPIPTQTRA